MKKLMTLMLLMVLAISMHAQKEYKYESVEGDPMKARIYTLDNGLKVYLTVNKRSPRIQTYIAVRTGSKNDPAETTGLAHYLEHLMFKGTTLFGTQNYEAERPLLDSIRSLYEVYRTKTDPAERTAIYHRIDSISGVASRIAIANEYDKLMAGIGAEATNAHTSEDETVYQEDIPANEIERWAMIQSERFQNMVIRGFHTELEAVYEEYNRGLTNDFWKIFEKTNALLFPHHPYGTQTTIGTQEHLKNPSIVNIENYFKKYYVPNNVAITMSGDMDMDETIRIIDRYFGSWKRGADPEPMKIAAEEPLKGVKSAEILGPQQDMVVLAWRMPGLKENQLYLMDVVNSIIQNGKTGLFDVNLTMQQKVLEAEAFNSTMTDYSAFMILGLPKEGQTLDEVKDLMLTEIGKLLRGEFDTKVLEGIINNKRLDDMRSLENNASRASKMYSYFIHGLDWKDFVGENERLAHLTKKDVVDFANNYLSTEDYVILYKRQGTDPNVKKIDKPQISPIEMNRDKTSTYVSDILAIKVKDIEPKFFDPAKDVEETRLKNGVTMLYRQNTENERFLLTYRIERGDKHDHLLSVATDYIDYLGTNKRSQEELAAELYRLACDVSFSSGSYNTVISISGLAENEAAAIRIMEDWLKNAKPEQEIYDELVADILRAREMNKTDENTCLSRLMSYAQFGPVNASTDLATEEELRNADPRTLINKLQDLANYPQIISYYGPTSSADIVKLLNKTHKANPKAQNVDVWSLPTLSDRYQQQTTTQNEVYIAPYESKAVKLVMFSNNGQVYDPALDAEINLFNEYFGGSMNAIVFQELREARGLAYSAGAAYSTPGYIGGNNTFRANIGSQNDKMGDCLDVFHEIIEHMPAVQNAFDLAKDAQIKRLRTSVTTGSANLSYYMWLRKMGFDHDPDIDIFRRMQTLTLDDLIRFSKENVAGRTYKFLVLGDESNLDMKRLESLGTIHRLSLKDIFGY